MHAYLFLRIGIHADGQADGRQSDRQTDKHTARQTETDRRTDGQTESQRDRETERQRDRETERQSDRVTDGQTDRRRDAEMETDGQMGRQTLIPRYILTNKQISTWSACIYTCNQRLFPPNGQQVGFVLPISSACPALNKSRST